MLKLHIDMDDTLLDYKGAYTRALKQTPDQMYPQAQYGFFLNLEPLPDAIETVKFLQSCFEVFFLTAPSVKNPWSYTEKRLSIEKHFGIDACDNLIIARDKSLLMGDFLIDNEKYKNKQFLFGGTFIHFGSDQFKDWRAVRAYLMPFLSI